MNYIGEERRQTPPPSDKELYTQTNLEKSIQVERRADALDRLREVKEQKRTWQRIFIYCLIMNLIFIGFALAGAFLYD